jgi:hypothetical protein
VSEDRRIVAKDSGGSKQLVAFDDHVEVWAGGPSSEMLGRFVNGFMAARADRRDLELRKRAQGRNPQP